MNTKKCFWCNYKDVKTEEDYENDEVMFTCPVCGRYKLKFTAKDENTLYTHISSNINRNKLASYLFYNGFKVDNDESKYYIINASGKKEHNYDDAVEIDGDDVNIWYPDKFSEKVDMILLYLHNASKHIGEEIELTKEEMFGCLFVDRYDFDGKDYTDRDDNKIKNQAFYILHYLNDVEYIQGGTTLHGEEKFSSLKITPKGYTRIDELQKEKSNSIDVLVAMDFKNTKPLREAIREGIKSANYNPIFIDEVQYNDLITPELLKYIRNSKFVVVDLTHRNNGAYFEEGYALGVGKTVIQLCKSTTIKKLHFDIAQKNTIVWTQESEIPELLKRRIEATIE